MLLAVDVDYKDDSRAVAAGVAFRSWPSGTIEDVVRRDVFSVRPYQPGRFFERELPCILALLETCSSPIKTIIIDGYVYLGSDQRDGLGARLFEALGGEIPIVGVAKTKFQDTPAEAEVLRGSSSRPLYVTSVGLDDAVARDHVRSMHGNHRIPTILAAVDRECRNVA